MRLSTPEKVKTLQRKLYRKAKQEPNFRFYALYDKVCRADILQFAYRLERANGGAPGVDGVSFRDIEAEGVEVFLATLGEELESKCYRAQAVRRVWIPKPDGSQRALGIPTLKDRVAQMAVKLVIEPIFEADFCESSYGFRPKRSAHAAVDAVAGALLKGHHQVIDADLSKYFDTIPHGKLLATVAERISDGAVLALIKQWLKAPVVEEDEDGKRRTAGGGKSNRRGTPQGGVISPLLANLYLHLLDRIWERHAIHRRYRAQIVRYADDLVVLCAGDTEPAKTVLQEVLTRLELSLNESKTKVLDARETSFEFLGFSFELRHSRKSGKRYPHVEPSKQAQQRLRARIKQLTDRRLTPIPMVDVVGTVNRLLRGWSGYFHHRNCSNVFKDVRWYVEERMRTHLRKRHQLKDRSTGYWRFPNRVLYARYGLYQLPATAGWTAA